MKILLFLTLFLATTQYAFAQTEQFKKGQVDIQVGVGFINTMNTLLKDAGTGATSKFTTPPPVLSAEYGIIDQFSIGAFISQTNSEIRLSDGSLVETDKITFIGTRGLYHLDVHPKIDAYGGITLAYGIIKATQPGVFGDPDQTATNGNVYYQLTAGARYSFAKPLGVFFELGYGITVLNLGLNLKF